MFVCVCVWVCVGLRMCVNREYVCMRVCVWMCFCVCVCVGVYLWGVAVALVILSCESIVMRINNMLLCYCSQSGYTIIK